MLWAKILLAIVLLTVLLCRTRVGVWAAFGGDVVRLDVKLGLLRLHILPAKPKKAEKPQKEKKPKKAKEEKPEKERAKPPIAWEDIQDALRTLVPALGRCLRRMGRGIRFQPLRLSLVLGGLEDPAAAARLYGELQAAVWGGMPRLEKLADVRDPYIHTDVDFLSPKTAVEGEAGVSLRVGTLIAVGFGLAVPALKWFLRWRKRCKARPPEGEPEGPGKTEEPAA